MLYNGEITPKDFATLSDICQFLSENPHMLDDNLTVERTHELPRKYRPLRLEVIERLTTLKEEIVDMYDIVVKEKLDENIDIQAHVNTLWESLKTENSTELWVHITSLVIVVGVIGMATCSVYIKKNWTQFLWQIRTHETLPVSSLPVPASASRTSRVVS